MGVLKVSLYILIGAILYQQYEKLYGPRLPANYGGFSVPGWERVAKLYEEQLEHGIQHGGAFNVFYRGQHVVSVWGGYADKEAIIPWREDTLSIYCSVTKLTAALTIQMLVDRGLIDMDQPVATYWPEFAQQGKEKITVEQLMSHQAGIAYVDDIFSIYDIKDNPKSVAAALAAQKPNWNPGEHFGYHAISFALLVDEVVRRVDPQQRSVSEFFKEEVAEPFGIEFHVGLPLEKNYRSTRVYNYPPSFGLEYLAAMKYWIVDFMALFSDSSISKIWKNPIDTGDTLHNPYGREIPFGSGNGFGTGSSIAKLMGILANGGKWEGKRLLSTEGIKRLGSPLVSGTDHTWFLTKQNIKFGPGPMIYPSPNTGNTFGHCGLGGQMGYADPSLKLGWSYLTNHFTVYTLGDRPATEQLKQAMYQCALALEEM